MKQRKQHISNPLSGGGGRSQEGIDVGRKIATALAAFGAVFAVLFVVAATWKPDHAGGGDYGALNVVEERTGGSSSSSSSTVVQKSIRGETAPPVGGGSLEGGAANTDTNNADASSAAAAAAAANEDYITLHTAHGNIQITLRPDLSAPSVQYVRDVINAGCDGCNLYRAEKSSLLQGIFKSSQDVVKPNTIFGDCPEESENIEQDCPKHDPNCGCHGPVMVKGMVGWAGGTPGGPDFFIETYEEPATFWGNQHTVWGLVKDDASLDVINRFWELPASDNDGIHMLNDAVPFTPSLP